MFLIGVEYEYMNNEHLFSTAPEEDKTDAATVEIVMDILTSDLPDDTKNQLVDLEHEITSTN